MNSLFLNLNDVGQDTDDTHGGKKTDLRSEIKSSGNQRGKTPGLVHPSY